LEDTVSKAVKPLGTANYGRLLKTPFKQDNDADQVIE
jgi:hypothetical protein